MDILQDKQYKTYAYISRYSSFPIYYNTVDDKYVYSLTEQLLEDVPYTAHKVGQKDTLDSLALTYYGRPDLFWVIADYNRINDPFIKLSDNLQIIKIPTLSNIEFGEIR